jgi:hypothetical protein
MAQTLPQKFPLLFNQLFLREALHQRMLCGDSAEPRNAVGRKSMAWLSM